MLGWCGVPELQGSLNRVGDSFQHRKKAESSLKAVILLGRND